MPPPLIIAHRGASFDAPENTLVSFELAWQQRADGAEGDFHLTRDNQIVCIHDATTRRTASVDFVVADHTLAELARLDVGSHKHPRFANQRIPTLEQVLQILPSNKLFYIEVKCGPEILPVLEQTIARSKLNPQQLRLLCFDANVIALAGRMLPMIKTHWLVEYSVDIATGLKTPSPHAILDTLQQIKAAGLNSQADPSILTPDFIAVLTAQHLETAAWTVDDAILARRLSQAGVTSLTTNRPRWFAFDSY